MKKYIFILFLTLFLMSCYNNKDIKNNDDLNQKEISNNKTSEVVAPPHFIKPEIEKLNNEKKDILNQFNVKLQELNKTKENKLKEKNTLKQNEIKLIQENINKLNTQKKEILNKYTTTPLKNDSDDKKEIDDIMKNIKILNNNIQEVNKKYKDIFKDVVKNFDNKKEVLLKERDEKINYFTEELKKINSMK